MSRRSPYVWRNVWNNFVNSLKPKKRSGDFKGEDHFGNKYYEIPANPSEGKRKPVRWFEPRETEDFDTQRSVEWDAWLRLRRDDPPTVEEVMKNLAIKQQKETNAKELEAKSIQERIEMGKPEPTQDTKGRYSYPQYNEFQTSNDKIKNKK